MKTVNFETLSINDSNNNYIVLESSFDMPNLDNTLQEVNKYLQKNFSEPLANEFAHLSETDKQKPIIIQIQVNFYTKKMDKHDLLFMIQMISSHMHQLLKTSEHRNNEHRFGVPENLLGLNDTTLHTMNFVNNKTLVNEFNYTIDFVGQKSDKKNQYYHFAYIE